MNKTHLEKYIHDILLNEFRSRYDLVEIIVRMRISTSGPKDPQIPDIITNIRVLKGVSTARQISTLKKVPGGKDVVDLSIKYMPDFRDPHKYTKHLLRLLKRIDGIEIVKVLSVGGYDIRDKDGAPYVL